VFEGLDANLEGVWRWGSARRVSSMVLHILAISEFNSDITGMFSRLLQARTETLLNDFEAVAILGARQVGTTTLALR
jgi:hypothetical protein